ncbi:MAG: hypothetical protein AB7T10_00005, partial [bacterium]
LWELLIVLLSTWLFSDDLQDTITLDSIATDTNSISIINPQTKKEKSHFSIGYTGGICRTGQDLEKYPAEPMDIFAASYYMSYLNFSYQINFSDKHKISLGFGFGWLPILTNRMLVLWLSDGTMIDATEWSISPYQYSLKYWFSKKYFVGIDVDYVIAKTKEVNLTDGNSSVITARKCIGGGVSFGWEEEERFLDYQRIIPYIFLKVGWANEYWNSSPWDWGDEKLDVGLCGLYFGLKYNWRIK